MSLYQPAVKPLYRRLFLLTLTLLSLVILILIFPLVGDLLVVLVISLVLTYIFKPGVAYLEHYGVNPVISITSIFVSGLLFIGTLFVFFAPRIIDQAADLINQLQKVDFISIYTDMVGWMDEKIPGLSTLIGAKPDKIEVWIDRLGRAGAALIQQSDEFVTGAINIIALATIVPFITFFMLRDGSSLTKQIIAKIPNRYFEMALSLAYRIDQQLGNYIRSVLLESLIIGILTWVALEMLGVKFAVMLGMLNGALNSIPFFGPLIAYFPIGLVVLVTYNPPALGLFWMVVILISVQVVDNILAKPLLISRSVHIHPAIVLLAVLIGGKLAGAIGMFVAVPVYAVVQVIVVDSYKHLKDYRIF